jgi:hypothetical protein
MNKKKKYISEGHITWTMDLNCVKVYDSIYHKIEIIEYPGAALWDLIQQKYPVDQIILMMAALTKDDKSHAEEWITKAIQAWLNRGLVK